MTVTLVVALVGLAISLFAVYFSQIRGARMKAELIQPPTGWVLGLRREAGYGTQMLASTDTATHCGVSATTYALIANDGPKGGAVWNLHLRLSNLPEGCVLEQPFVGSEPQTLGGNDTDGIEVSYSFVWPVEHSRVILSAFAAGTGTTQASIGYSRHRLLRSSSSTTNQTTVPFTDLWRDLRQSAANQNINLATLAIRSEVDKALSQAFQPLGLPPDQTVSLRYMVWQTILQLDAPLQYHIEGDDGAAHLQFHLGLVSNAITADRRYATLSKIADVHRQEVMKAQMAFTEMKKSLGL